MAQKKYSLSNISATSPVIEQLIVCSFEMHIYLVELSIGGEKGLVYDGNRPKRFNGAEHIRDVFAPYKVLRAEMRHESPYDEMIGNPQSVQSLSRLPFSMARPRSLD
jgi:hypothetical protein